MDFVLKFTTGDPNKSLLMKMGQAGIDFLDIFREDYPMYNDIPSKNIHFRDYCPINGHSYLIEIGEQLARESGLFIGKTGVTVKIGDRFQKYMGLEVSEDIRIRDKPWPYFNYILPYRFEKYLYGVEVKYVYNERSLLEEWKEAGFPLEWI